MLQRNQIDQLVNEIVAGYNPDKIYLFGSYATGNMSGSSDIDLFVVKETSKRKIERNREVRRCILNYPLIGLDIVVYTPSELEEAMHDTVNIGKEAVSTGKLLYERI